MLRFLIIASTLFLTLMADSSAQALEPVKVSPATTEIGYMFEEVRKALNKKGYDAGPAGPKITKKTMAAFTKYRTEKNLKGIFDVPKALGVVFPRACFWTRGRSGSNLHCPDGCKTQIAATQDNVGGFLVSCPGKETTLIPRR